LINPDLVFYQDLGRNENFSRKVRLKKLSQGLIENKKNQSLLENFQSNGNGCPIAQEM
jgi:hypothetical protein